MLISTGMFYCDHY